MKNILNKLPANKQQFLDTHFKSQENYDDWGVISRHYIKK